MPVYVYGCDDCKERTELTHRMSEIVKTYCPTCGTQMHRIPQPFSAHIRVMDPGLRNTIEIHNFNKEKYYANKTRREAQRAAERHAAELRRSPGENPAA